MSEIQLYRGKYNQTEKMIIESKTQPSIKSRRQDANLAAELKNVLSNIMIDVGIRMPKEEYRRTALKIQLARAIDTIIKYYADFSINDIKQAFEFMMAGKLDDYIIKKDDKMAVDHFQSFDNAYINRVLKPYRAYRKDTITKMKTNNPEPQKLLSAGAISEIEDETWADIKRAFKVFEDTGRVEFYLPDVIVNFLNKKKLIQTGCIDLTERDLQESIHMLFSRPFIEKETAKEVTKKGYESGRVHVIALNKRYCKIIEEFFTSLLNEGKTIEDIMNK